MKTYKLFWVASFLFISITAFSQTQLENGGFENWTDINHSTGWNSQIGSGFATVYTAEKTTDSHSGNYAAKLISKTYLALTIPGMITLGKFDLTTLKPTGGVPYSDRPTAISFYMKYETSLDTMMMLAYFTKWNSTTQHTDTIGGTAYINREQINGYTKISMPIIYKSLEIPDTFNILFLSSLFKGNNGTSLFIDDITMESDFQTLPTICFPATNITQNQFTANWFSNIFASSFFIDVAYDEGFTDFVGIYNNYNTGNVNFLTISGLTNNTEYFYRVRVQYEAETSVNSNTISLTTKDYTDIFNSDFDNILIYSYHKNVIIDTKNIENNQITIYDLKGSIIEQFLLNSSKTKIPIEESGIYIIKITNNDNQIIKKIVVY